METTSHVHARRDEPHAKPGPVDSAILLTDSVLTIVELAKVEALQALETLPRLLMLACCRLPVLLLTWLSFAVLVACAIYTSTGNLVAAAGSFFLLQLALTLVLEYRTQRLHERMKFSKTREALSLLQGSLKART